MLCVVLVTVTLNAVLVVTVAGAAMLALVIFSSAVAVTAVVALPLVALLFAVLESLTCCWSIATDAEPLKLWFDWPVQVTDQLALTGVAVLVASEVLLTI